MLTVALCDDLSEFIIVYVAPNLMRCGLSSYDRNRDPQESSGHYAMSEITLI